MNGFVISCFLLGLLFVVKVNTIQVSINGRPGTGVSPISEGRRVAFLCTSNVTVDVMKLTKKNNNNLFVVIHTSNNTKQLIYYFNISRADHEARYRCDATIYSDVFSPYTSVTKWFKVLFSASKLSLIVQPKQNLYLPANNISVKCQSNEGNPKPEIIWLKNGLRFDESTYAILKSSKKGNYYSFAATSVLYVETTLELNQGSFVCLIRENEVVNHTYTVQIAFPPDLSTLQLSPNSPTGKDEWHSLQCVVSGSNPTPSIEWWLNKQKLTGNEPGIKITPQKNASKTRYNSAEVIGVLQVLMEEAMNGEEVECRIKYNNTVVTGLQQTHVLNVLAQDVKAPKVANNLYMYIGAGVGGGVVAIGIIITICIVCAHWRKKSKTKEDRTTNEERYDYIIESSNLSYEKANGRNSNGFAMKPQPSSRENDYIQSISSVSDTYTTSGAGLKSLSQLNRLEVISEGVYATVKYGMPKLQTGLRVDQPIVAKILKGNAKMHFRQTLQSQLQALYIIKSHEHVLEFSSFIDNKKTLALVTNFYESGDLLQFLRNQNVNNMVSARDLIGMTRDVASGMNYLSSHQPPFLHHQLSACHVLVGERLTCKVFGFASQDSVRERDKCQLKYKFPADIRWKAPELLEYSEEHSVQSDVWAFGVLMYEVASLGNGPYPGLSGDEAIKAYILDRQVIPRPVFVSSQFYDIMRNCWSWLSHNRPTFASLTSHLDYLQTDTQLHIDVNTLMHPNISGHMRVSERQNRKY